MRIFKLKLTFDANFLFSSTRVREKIHLDADLAHRTFFRPSGIWNKNILKIVLKLTLITLPLPLLNFQS